MLRYLGIVPAALLIGMGAAFAQGGPLPWGQLSDQVAWETFAQIVAPSGNPQNTRVEFETWASDQDIYQTSPPVWPAVNAPKQLIASALGTIRHGVAPTIIAPSQCIQGYDQNVAKQEGFPLTGCIGEEVRRNWASFQYIVSNNLFSRAGLAQAFQKKLKIDMPADSIEFKGDWVPVSNVMQWLKLTEKEVDDLYYTNTATAGSTTTKFALVSFHFSTKQIKDWVWADFENAKNPGRCDDIGCHDAFGAVEPNVAAKSTNWQEYGTCEKTSELLSMFTNAGISPVWKNYCLKGSQITFTELSGKPTLLGNSVIEALNASVPIKDSSCITCHGYASVNSQGAGNGNLAGGNFTGAVDPTKLQGSLTSDFIWGVLFAQ